jgi:hypothetical protein
LLEGPCYEAITGGPLLMSGLLGEDSRWPRYGPKAAQLQLRSQLAVLLSAEGRTVVLNLYSSKADALEDVDGIAELFGIYVRAILSTAQEAENWARAVDTRTLIGQATGIFMVRYRVSPTAAFNLLIRLSQTTNTKLRVVAAEVVQLSAEKT